MIEDGLFEQFPCDSIFAMHNAPGLPVGQFSATAGVVAAAGAFFDIRIDGVGAHGAHRKTVSIRSSSEPKWLQHSNP